MKMTGALTFRSRFLILLLWLIPRARGNNQLPFIILQPLNVKLDTKAECVSVPCSCIFILHDSSGDFSLVYFFSKCKKLIL